MDSTNEWYEDGLEFDCTMCGECCTGPTGYVGFTEAEGRAIAERVGLDYKAFLKKFAHRMKHGGDGYSLNEVLTEHGHDCVFLDRETEPGKALCSIHEVRPMQCRTWPWWPENLQTPRAWQQAGRKCEGIGRGAVVTIEQIRIQRDRTPS